MEILVRNNNAFTYSKSETYTQFGQLIYTSSNAKYSFKVYSVGLYIVKIFGASVF